MAYTLTIFPEDGGALPHKLEEATSDEAAIAEAMKIVEEDWATVVILSSYVRMARSSISRARCPTASTWIGVTHQNRGLRNDSMRPNANLVWGVLLAAALVYIVYAH